MITNKSETLQNINGKTCLFELHFLSIVVLTQTTVVQKKWNLFEPQPLCKDMAADFKTAYYLTRKEEGGIPLI